MRNGRLVSSCLGDRQVFMQEGQATGHALRDSEYVSPINKVAFEVVIKRAELVELRDEPQLDVDVVAALLCGDEAQHIVMSVQLC